jgi:transcriptional regulator with XRE-family HTH domain
MSTLRSVDDTPYELGDLLRHWRAVRRMSQLDMAVEAMTTPRYVSFVETGRARPSREMVVRLARALDVPLRDRNGLLLAAGFAPLYPVGSLDAPQLGRVESALTSMLERHEPFPAVVMDRGWWVLRANQGARTLFGRLLAPRPIPEPANVLKMMIEPGPVRDAVINWRTAAPALLERVRREAVGGVVDRVTADLVSELRRLPEVEELLTDVDATTPTMPVLDIHFDVDGVAVRFFSVVSTVGTPIDITAQELRFESFFASDLQTEEAWTLIARGAPPG